MPLIVGTQNSPRSADQLWKYVPVLPGSPLPQGFIQSQMDPNLVVDITGGATRVPSTPLEVWTRNSAALSGNQQWFLLPAPGNSYHPRITAIVQAGAGFSITGAGFQAGTFVWANYNFFPRAGGVESGSFFATTDFGGGFVNNSPITILFEGPGELQVAIVFSFPSIPNPVVAEWDGSKFKFPA
jgi:hypothetical protein